MPTDAASFELDRRQFIHFVLSCSAALLLGETGSSVPPRSKSYAAFEEFPVGTVRPEGWLRHYLVKQAEGLGSQLPHVSWPFTDPFWKGAKKGESWWPWEQVAYWVDGATRLALVLDDPALMQQVRETIDFTLKTIEIDGYIGPDFFKDPRGDFHRWPHAIFFRGLSALADAKPAMKEAIVEAMTSHYLLDPAGYGKPTRNVVNIESILWCHGQTGDARFLHLAERAWEEFLTVAADPEHGDLSKDRVMANTSINAHGVTYIETAKQPAILFAHSGEKEYLDFALAAQRRIFDHHMLVDGIPSTSEWYRGVGSLDSHETCDITDHTWSWGHLLIATGDGIWGDRIERACFNAGPGAIKNDWRAVQYFSCPNQVIATLDSDHNAMAYGGRMMAYQPNPGQHTACCGGNIHRLMPNYASRMWMKTPDGGIAATLYGPSQLKTNVGKKEISITQTTDYPFGEEIHLTLGLQKPTKFPLKLRIPTWCESPRLEVNGHPAPIAIKNGFTTLNQLFHPGDKVTLTLPMKTKVTRWPDNGVALEHGPLVYALPIQEEWTAVVEPNYSTKEFPSWNAVPKSAWNYGVLDAEKAQFVRLPMSEDPWSNPPSQIRVSALLIPGWEFVYGPRNHRQRFTPPLPDLTKPPTGKPEPLTLVPYGSTQLRVTVFPELPSGR